MKWLTTAGEIGKPLETTTVSTPGIDDKERYEKTDTRDRRQRTLSGALSLKMPIPERDHNAVVVYYTAFNDNAAVVVCLGVSVPFSYSRQENHIMRKGHTSGLF